MSREPIVEGSVFPATPTAAVANVAEGAIKDAAAREPVVESAESRVAAFDEMYRTVGFNGRKNPVRQQEYTNAGCCPKCCFNVCCCGCCCSEATKNELFSNK